MPGKRAAAHPATLVALLKGAGHAAFTVTPAQLANQLYCAPDNLDLMVLPAGDLFPLAAHQAFVRYLRRGGAFVSTGGLAFDTPVVQVDNKWYSPRALPAPKGPETAILADLPAGWTPSTNRKDPPAIAAGKGPTGQPGMEVSTPEMTGWDTAVSPSVAGKLPAGWTITRLWLRGETDTTRLWVEWAETDGSRWHCAVEVGPTWREVVLAPKDFAYWHDNPSVGRGGAGDHFRPEQAARLQIGVASDIAASGRPHKYAVAGVRVQVDTLSSLRTPPPDINTRYARIRDAMWPEADQIGVFDPSFPLRAATKLTNDPATPGLPTFQVGGNLQGWAAVAMLGLNGHGFGPNHARWVPLLETVDRFDHPQGPAGALVHHYAGNFAGSSWAVFGLTSQDLFDGRHRGGPELLRAACDALLRRCYLHDTDSAYACYRRDETAVLRTKVSNYGREKRSLEVVFRMGWDADSPAIGRVRLQLDPGQTTDAQVKQPVFIGIDRQPFCAELVEGQQVLDRETSLYVVQPPDWRAAGPAVTRDGTRFRIDGRAQFLMGCQTYWGQNGSVTARSPQQFDRDFSAMRDMGLRWTRLFMPFKTEEDKRISDAVVVLAGRHGLLLYHTPNLTNTADPQQLADEARTAREIADRYRGCPHLLVDICNEPAFSGDDAGLIKSFGRQPKKEGPFEDLDVAAWFRHMATAQRAWAASNLAAVHEGDPLRLASVGWSQGYGWGGVAMKDPPGASLDLDFTDRHYYGNPAGLGPELKDLDLRGLGKPLVLGECGAKDHPTFAERDPWGMGDDDTRYDQRFLYLGHHALGLGAAVISSWHWRDPMEGIFPCGLVNSTGVPRPTAYVYRAMALAFGRLQPAKVMPRVALLLPDNARFGGGHDAAVRAIHRASELLLDARADFSVLPEGALEQLSPLVKTIVYPVPTAPPDAVLDQLAAFVRDGGALLMSGDLGFDGERRPAAPERLAKLCGAKPAGVATAPPLAWPPAAAKSVPATGSGLSASVAHPLRSLDPAGADVLATCDGRPLVTRFALGSGQVWLNVEPSELAPVKEPAHAALYRAFLAAARAPRLQVTPDRPDLDAYHVAGDNGEAWVFHNAGPARAVTVGAWSLELAAGGYGYLQLGLSGELRVVEAEGKVSCAGQELVRVAGQAFVIADDEQPLAQSRTLLICPIQPGDVQVHTTAKQVLSAEAGEWRDGQWQADQRLPVALRDGWLKVSGLKEEPRAIWRVTLR